MVNHSNKRRLDIASLRAAYDGGETPANVIQEVFGEIEKRDLHPIWISLADRERTITRAQSLEGEERSGLPLYGIPFAVKDNFDVAGLETTAACPAYKYAAQTTATAVRKLEEAGAILVGKTNMDQFATGLVGTRTPYGACASVFSDRHISGGSSSGSAVAVARGLVSFALGTDTAGSGRVPAAFNNLIGLKPTRGVISAAGVVPACRSLDCVSVFALTAADAASVFQIARGTDTSDPFSLANASEDSPAPWLAGGFAFAVPQPEQWEFFGDSEAGALYEAAIAQMVELGGAKQFFDFGPFHETAKLLYSGPWVAERLAAIQTFYSLDQDQMDPVVREIIGGGMRYSAVDCFTARYRLEELRKAAAEVWKTADFLLLPTTGTIYTHDEIAADPIRLNANLGRYTNFVNLLDLAAVAVPAGFRSSGLPFGVTLMGVRQTDVALLKAADRLHRRLSQTLGGLTALLADTPILEIGEQPDGCTLVAVVGAHLTGQPLNHQLTTRGARLARTTKTAAGYRLYALSDTIPAKPGLVRDPGFAGPGIEVEIWAMPTKHLGGFVAEAPAPLGIGNLELSDGSTVKGFICEPYAITGAKDITHFASWRAYLGSL